MGLKEKIVICSGCADAIREFSLYCWDTRSETRDVPIKENDNAMDVIRYFAAAMFGSREKDLFAATFVERDAVFHSCP